MGSINTAKSLIPIRDQGQLGSCTAFAGTAAMEFCQIRDQIAAKKISSAKVTASNITSNQLSPLFLYYSERENDPQFGGVTVDSGATMENIIYTLAEDGVCTEAEWPYDLATVFRTNFQVIFCKDSNCVGEQ